MNKVNQFDTSYNANIKMQIHKHHIIEKYTCREEGDTQKQPGGKAVRQNDK